MTAPEGRLAEIDAAVKRAFREAPHVDDCATMTDGPGEPLRCTCWKDELRLAMLHLYGLSERATQATSEFCMARGPRDSKGDGRPVCWLSPDHAGQHRGDARDGWQGVSW